MKSFSPQLFPTLQIKAAILAIFLSLGFFVAQLSSQSTITAEELLRRLDRAEPVELDGVTITGNLDFTQLDKKFRGGSYGACRGVVKEFYTKLLAPLTLRNCTLQGDLITYSEEQRPGLKKENFVAFEELAVFQNCRFEGEVNFEKMTFYQGVEFRNCRFEENMTFEKVHFAKPPVFSGNELAGKLTNHRTNWTGNTGELVPPPPALTADDQLTIVLKNSSLRTIDIRFGRTTWSLSPQGKSTLLTELGEEIFLWENGRKGRLLLTVQADLAGQTVDVAKL